MWTGRQAFTRKKRSALGLSSNTRQRRRQQLCPIWCDISPSIKLTPKAENQTNPYDYLWYHTLLHIGCEKGSGATDISTLFSGVWNHIKNRNVTRAHDGAALQYYGSWVCQNFTTGALIKNKDGQCGAWAAFLLDILKAQGFQETINYFQITPMPDFGDGFYVKTWSFSGAGTSGDSEFPFLNVWSAEPPYFVPTGPFDWSYAEVTETSPLPGQNQPSPQSRFLNHQFARVLGQYYDPSYGVQYPSQSNGLPDADGAISAFYKEEDWPSNIPPKADFIRTNPTGVQHMVGYFTY